MMNLFKQEKRIILPWSNEDEVAENLTLIQRIVGSGNISLESLRPNKQVAMITVRCSRKQWEEIRFQLDLSPVYC